MRKLASIQRITDIKPNPNADSIETLTVLGWNVTEKKNKFAVGDLCIYFEIDSILPQLPEFSFMEKHQYILRTIRLRGQLSQGLCGGLDILPDGLNIQEGMDVTELLGIKKFERKIPVDMEGISRGYFPTIVGKTDETRVQSCPQLLNEFAGKRVAFTQKIEGTSASYVNDQGDIHICSHTHSMIESEASIYWKMEKKYNISKILKQEGHFAIQGEITGPDIDGNQMGLLELDFFVFKVFNNDTQSYLSIDEMVAFCERNRLKHVPILAYNIAFDFTIEELLELAKGNYQPSGKKQEGIVIVPMQPCYSEELCGNLSMKVINNEYLL